MVIIMKNNKMVLPVIIILLIIFLPLTIIGSYKSLSKGTSLENPSKEHKYNNKLFYYDSEGKLLGTYECTSSDCDDAQTEIDDEINDFYKEGDKNDIGVFNTDNVFIKDNDKIYLYSLSTKIKLLTLNMLKNYNSDIEGNYLIVKNEENLYGLFDLNVKVRGDLEVDSHHTIEDTGIVLGQAIAQALGDKAGIKRYGYFVLPMDEVLALGAVDLSGRPYLNFQADFTVPVLGTMDTEMVREFFYAVSYSAAMNLHLKILDAGNNHHMAEALFKAFGKALDMAVSEEPRIKEVWSTKGSL